MNCENCGAPLQVVDGREHFTCAYCFSFLFPTDLHDSADRIKSTGQQTDRQCPVCELPMVAGAIDGRSMCVCQRCRGILVDSEDFLKIVSARRIGFKGAPADPRLLNQEELNRNVDCPKCRKPMEVHPYYGPGSVVIDSCRRCSLIWLDHGEVAAIERAPGRRW